MYLYNMLGEERILYVLVEPEDESPTGATYLPIGCLTSNGFEETTDTVGTTTRANDGWTSSRANLQSFSVSFDGIQIKTTGANCENLKVSYDKLKQLKRTREQQKFQIRNTKDDGNREFFNGIIVDLGEAANVGDFLTFTGSIQGNGKPVTIVTDCNIDSIDVAFTYDSIERFDSSTTIFND